MVEGRRRAKMMMRMKRTEMGKGKEGGGGRPNNLIGRQSQHLPGILSHSLALIFPVFLPANVPGEAKNGEGKERRSRE